MVSKYICLIKSFSSCKLHLDFQWAFQKCFREAVDVFNEFAPCWFSWQSSLALWPSNRSSPSHRKACWHRLAQKPVLPGTLLKHAIQLKHFGRKSSLFSRDMLLEAITDPRGETDDGPMMWHANYVLTVSCISHCTLYWSTKDKNNGIADLWINSEIIKTFSKITTYLGLLTLVCSSFSGNWWELWA